jgi:hypothetical protein
MNGAQRHLPPKPPTMIYLPIQVHFLARPQLLTRVRSPLMGGSPTAIAPLFLAARDEHIPPGEGLA